MLSEHVEVESGKRNDRPALAKAIAEARAYAAVLSIAKLDRLSRDAHFLIGLERAGVEFIACDNPTANSLTIGILALVAEQERKAISARTKAALAIAKARGTRLGNPNGAAHLAGRGNAEAAASVREKADAFASKVAPIIANIRLQGKASANAIAAELNNAGQSNQALIANASSAGRIPSRLCRMRCGCRRASSAISIQIAPRCRTW